MNRRDAISRVALLLGGTVIGSDLFLQFGCTPKAEKINNLFDADQLKILDEIAETILPQTTTPGAKAAKVGQFMTVMVQDCYNKEDQEVFVKGISKLDDASNKKFGKKFLEASAEQRKGLLNELDKEQKEFGSTKKPEEPNHYFRMMKELTLLGFFTSEVGATKVLRYLPVPGKYEGCIPYKKGDRAWAIN
jgi:hypothetical protein